MVKRMYTSEISITHAVTSNPNANSPVLDVAAMQTTGATFQINNGKFYVPVVTLSINDNIKFLENIKQEFKRTISWNKYRSEIITQPKNSINKLFVLSFKNGNNGPWRDSFDDYYIPLAEIKDFNPLIDNKPFSDQPIKNKQETYEKLIELSRNNDSTTGNLFDYLYHQNYYKLIAIDLPRQASASIPQQINFTGKWKEEDSATIFCLCKALKSYCELFFRFINCKTIM